jgi:hypothetical protein
MLGPTPVHLPALGPKYTLSTLFFDAVAPAVVSVRQVGFELICEAFVSPGSSRVSLTSVPFTTRDLLFSSDVPVRLLGYEGLVYPREKTDLDHLVDLVSGMRRENEGKESNE